MILENIKKDYIIALKNRDELKVNTLRFLMSEITNKEIELRPSGQTITDEVVSSVLQREVKKRKESAEIFANNKRQDLADNENAEIAVITEYLPKQLTEEEVEKIVREVKERSKASDFGSLMKLAMQELKGKAEGKIVGEIVKKVL